MQNSRFLCKRITKSILGEIKNFINSCERVALRSSQVAEDVKRLEQKPAFDLALFLCRRTTLRPTVSWNQSKVGVDAPSCRLPLTVAGYVKRPFLDDNRCSNSKPNHIYGIPINVVFWRHKYILCSQGQRETLATSPFTFQTFSFLTCRSSLRTVQRLPPGCQVMSLNKLSRIN